MSWSADFRAALASGGPLMMRYGARGLGMSDVPGLPWAHATAPGLPDSLLTMAAPPRIAGGRVAPVSWGASCGAAEWNITGDSAAADIALKAARGQLLELLAQPVGSGTWDRIWAGQFLGLSGVGPSWTMRAYDLVAACRSRLKVGAGSLGRLFNAAGNSTPSTAGYTVGDSTLYCSTVGLFREAGARGAVRVTNPSGDVFYLTYTGETSTSITGVSSAGEFGTTAHNAASGSGVAHIVLVEGHPVEIALKILTSTGSGTGSNGPFDYLPEFWGYALDQDWVDINDAATTRALMSASGGYSWSVLVAAPVDDGLAWLRALLAPAGLWLVLRQGQISLRCAQDPWNSTAVLSGLEVTEADIVSVDSWEAHALAANAYAYVVQVKSATGTEQVYEFPAGLPVSSAPTLYDMSTVLYDNENPVRDEVKARLAPWAHRNTFRLGLTLRGLRWAGLAEGDLLPTTCRRFPVRAPGGGLAALERWPFMVTSVSPDWSTGRTSVSLEIPWPL